MTGTDRVVVPITSDGEGHDGTPGGGPGGRRAHGGPGEQGGRGGPGEPPETEAAWERGLATGLALLRRRLTGAYEVDELGFDRELTDDLVVPALRLLYHHWFSVRVRGLEHVPDTGGALLVGNHAGVLPVDALMLGVALYDEHPENRKLRLLGADLVYQLPFLSHLARKSGSTLATPSDAEHLLRAGEIAGVFPEGFKGIGKPFAERYRLRRFGRGGFVTSAIRAGVPIVPVAIVGAEEIYPKIADFKPLARMLGLPYFPITPTFPWLGPLGLVPLPSKWIIEFGEPVRTDGLPPDAAEDPMVVFDLTDRVRGLIQTRLDHLVEERGSAF
ncbi:MAG: glycerol acyltransferase [Streptosporangiales bacterium]|nr:glycerol acyltransferase [Streptosporangiales bacterium]